MTRPDRSRPLHDYRLDLEHRPTGRVFSIRVTAISHTRAARIGQAHLANKLGFCPATFDVILLERYARDVPGCEIVHTVQEWM